MKLRTGSPSATQVTPTPQIPPGHEVSSTPLRFHTALLLPCYRARPLGMLLQPRVTGDLSVTTLGTSLSPLGDGDITTLQGAPLPPLAPCLLGTTLRGPPAILLTPSGDLLTTPWGAPALLGPSPAPLGTFCHHQPPAPPVRINPPSTRVGKDPISVPGDAHLEEVWGHLLLGQAALDVLSGTLGEGLRGERGPCHSGQRAQGNRG